jgi:hypothetical protein
MALRRWLTRWLAALCALAVCAATSQAATPPDSRTLLAQLDAAAAQTPPDEQAAFEQLIAAAYGVNDVAALRGQLSVALIYPSARQPAQHVFLFPARQVPQPAASCLKVVLAVRAANTAVEAPAGWKLKLGGGGTLGEITRRMISRSSNPDANRLLHYFGQDETNAWLRGLGFGADELYFARDFGDFAAAARGTDNTCTAYGLARFYFLLAQPNAVPDFAGHDVLGKVRLLLDSQGDCNNRPDFNDRLNGRFPAGVHFCHKTGSNDDVLGDGGYFVIKHDKCVLVVLDEGKNKPAMQQLGLAIYRQLAQ